MNKISNRIENTNRLKVTSKNKIEMVWLIFEDKVINIEKNLNVKDEFHNVLFKYYEKLKCSYDEVVLKNNKTNT